jgi:hypothetical protein
MISMPKQQAISLFGNYLEIESPLRRLKYVGFPMEQMSVIAQRDNRQDMITGISLKAYGNTDTNIMTQGVIVSLVTLIGRVRTAMIPELGAAMAAGKLADRISTSLIDTLIKAGVPPQKAKQYNHKVSQGCYLVIVEGTSNEINLVQTTLYQQDKYQWDVYDQLEKVTNLNQC